MILFGLLAGSLFAVAPDRPIAPPPHRSEFPKTFLWGAATAAYQVEGNNTASDLWPWEKERGWEPSGIATDSWERYAEDIRLLKDLGANTYRFSVEWGRILPEPGKPDEAAIAHYRLILQALKAAGIRPLVTLHHFTNPVWFWKKHPRGWKDPGAVDDYLDYVRLLDARLGSEVHDWATFNEPMVYLTNAYLTGQFPPGERGVLQPVTESILPAEENIVRAHKGAYAILHKPGTRVGIVQNISWVVPWKDEPEHIAAARRWDQFFHWDLLEKCRPALDYVGVNYYTRVYVRAFPFVFRPVNAFPFHVEVTYDRLGRFLFWLAGGRLGDGVKDDLGHEIYPEGIRFVTQAAWERLRVPIIVTENGTADHNDVYRAEYIRGHLRELARAVKEGVPVIGYIHWSLLDNYEWGSFTPRLGLYRVDREHGLARSLTQGGRAFQQFLTGR